MAYIVKILLTSLALMFLVARAEASQEFCLPDHVVKNGDITITALIGLRRADGMHCGKFSSDAFRLAAALTWVVEKLNTHTSDSAGFIPGVRIGLHIEDDCNLKQRSSQVALEVLSAISPRSTCQSPGRGDTAIHAGFIGLGGNEQTLAVANLLRESHLPFVGAVATTASLTNKTRYPNFVRTVPSDVDEIKVIMETARLLNWSFVALVYSNDTSGREGAGLLAAMAHQYGICFTLQEAVNNRRPDVFKTITKLEGRLLYAMDNHLGVIYFGSYEPAKLLLERQEEQRAKYPEVGNLSWIMPTTVAPRVRLAYAPKGRLASAAKVITVAHPELRIREFNIYLQTLLKDYLQGSINSSLHPWIDSFVQEAKKDCGTSAPVDVALACLSNRTEQWDTAHPDKEESVRFVDFIKTAVDAVYVLAVAAKNTHAAVCAGRPGVCPQLREAMHTSKLAENVRKVTVNYSSLPEKVIPETAHLFWGTTSFDDSGDVKMDSNTSVYTIHYQHGTRSRKIGKANTENVTLFPHAPSPSNRDGDIQLPNVSACRSKCQECAEQDDIPFSYIPGDVIVMAVLPQHVKSKHFECGSYKKDAYIAYEAFNHAILTAKTWYPSLNVGGLVIDDCDSALRTDYLMTQIFSKKHKLVDKISGHVIDASKIVLVVGGYNSDVSVRMADMFTRLRIPQISPASSSMELNDRIRFPYFLRTVPNDADKLKAIASTLQKLEIKYVSLIYSDNSYGRYGKEFFPQVAAQHQICVADPIRLTTDPARQSEMDEVIRALIRNSANAVVYLGNEMRVHIMLEALKEKKKTSNMNQGGFNFVFVTYGMWTDILDKTFADQALGSFSIVQDLQVHSDSTVFKTFGHHLRKMSLNNCIQCHWTRHFWQHEFQCNIINAFDKPYSKTCIDGLSISSRRANELAIEQLPISVIHAVLAGVTGIHRSMKRFCPPPCLDYSEHVKDTVDEIKRVKLNGTLGKAFRPFGSSGDGNRPLSVYNLQKGDQRSEYKYREVAKYDENEISWNGNEVRSYNDVGKESAPKYRDCWGSQCQQCSVLVKGESTPAVTGIPETQTCDCVVSRSTFITTVTILAGFLLLAGVAYCVHFCRKYKLVLVSRTSKGGPVAYPSHQEVPSKTLADPRQQENKAFSGSDAGSSIDVQQLNDDSFGNGNGASAVSIWTVKPHQMFETEAKLAERPQVPDTDSNYRTQWHPSPGQRTMATTPHLSISVQHDEYRYLQQQPGTCKDNRQITQWQHTLAKEPQTVLPVQPEKSKDSEQLTQWQQTLAKESQTALPVQPGKSKDSEQLTQWQHTLAKESKAALPVQPGKSKDTQQMTQWQQTLAKESHNALAIQREKSKDTHQITKWQHTLAKESQTALSVQPGKSKDTQQMTQWQHTLAKNPETPTLTEQIPETIV